MATPVYLKNLQLFVEANALPGADASPVSSFTDLSGNNRHLTAASDQPLVKAAAVNSKKSLIWNGSKNPLAFNGTFQIRCGFLVIKVNGEFTGDYQGILSSPVNSGILAGIGGSNWFYDFLYDYYEYRLNDRIYPKTQAPAPVDSWGIIYFKFWTNLLVEGIQLGQDRNFTDRKFDGEVALLALYDRNFCESEVKKMVQSIAFSYQLPIANVFPFQGSKTDVVTSSKRILTDEQDEPIVRVKRGARKLFDLNFTNRNQKEVIEAENFWNDFYPAKRYLYRDYEFIPPVDTSCRFPIPSEFQRSGGSGINSMAYQFQAIESIQAPLYEIPAAAPVIDTESPVITLLDLTATPPPPGYYEGEIMFGVAATDDVGIDHIDVFIDGDLFETIGAASGTITWDTKETSHTGATEMVEVKAIAYDGVGRVSLPRIVNVPVQNQPEFLTLDGDFLTLDGDFLTL